MKGTSLIVNIVLFMLVLVLFILHFTGGKSSTTTSSKPGVSSANGGVRIAYVKADSVILNYKLAEVLHNEFTQKQEAYSTEYGSKRRSFEKDAVSFQEKIQRGGFLSEESAVRERNRLAGIEQEIVKMDQELSAKLSEMQSVNTKQVLDSLMSCLKTYNAGNKYDYILNSSALLIGSEGDNITAEVLKIMNDKYTSTAGK